MFVETGQEATNSVSVVINEQKDDAEMSSQESSRNRPQDTGAARKSTKRKIQDAEMTSQESDRKMPQERGAVAGTAKRK